jgi:cholesterol transport system auxiliary component
MSRHRWFGALAALLLVLIVVGGCAALSPAGDPPQLYVLSPKSTFEETLPQVDWQLVIELPVAAAGLNTTRIAVSRTPLTVEYYARANWTDRAPVLVQTLLIESFENTGKIVSVGRESIGLRSDYILKTELREFEAVEEAGNTFVHVRINAKLVRMPDRSIIATHTVERKVPVEGRGIDGVVAAFDDALGKVMKRIVEWALTTPSSKSTRS